MKMNEVLVNITVSLHDKDWDSLQASAHKMIPSFQIMGIDNELDKVCTQACGELKKEYNLIRKAK